MVARRLSRRDRELFERVERALALMEARIDSELTDLRVIVRELIAQAHRHDELPEAELLNKRMEKLTGAVADLMARFPPDEGPGFSVKVPDA